MPNRIKGVFFDLDNTVLDFTKSESVSVRQAFKEVGLDTNDELISLYSRINDAQWKKLEKGLTTRERLIVERFELFYKELGITDISAEETQKAYGKYLSQSVFFVDGAVDSVKELKNLGYKVYIASNGTAGIQSGRISKSGLAPLFDGIFISETLGAYKPSPEYFTKALDLAGLKANETVMVGDSISSDINGGIVSGLYTVYYNPSKKEAAYPIKPPDAEISKMSELKDAVIKIDGKKSEV